MRMATSILLLALTVTLLACGRIYGPVAETKAFINEKEDVLLQISKKIEANPSAAGVDEARKVFEARKEGLKAKRRAIYEKPEGMNSDWFTMLLNSQGNDPKMFQMISTNLIEACSPRGGCPDALEKLSKLEKDFLETAHGK